MASGEDQPDILEQSRRLWEEAKHYRRDFDERMVEDIAFALDGDRYIDSGGNTKDRRRIQPVGREIPSKQRHIVAQVIKDRFLEVRPATVMDDPEEAEVAKKVLEHETTNPRKFYRSYRKRVCMQWIAGGLGVGAMEYDPKCDEIVFSVVPGDAFHWTPGFNNPHEINCPDVFHAKRMRISDIKRMGDQGWANTDEVVPDDGQRSSRNTGDPTLAPGTVSFNRSGGIPQIQPSSSTEEPCATVVLRWMRWDDETYDRPGKLKALDPKDRYMACMTCGYRESPPNGDGSQLPEMGGICPQCLAQGTPNVMERIDAEQPMDKVLRYPKGRLVIFAPFSNVVLYDDKWPWALRSVPYFVVKTEHPTKPLGQSETSLDWSMQLLADSSKRFGYEQMMSSRRIFGLVDAGGPNTITNQFGQPWMFSDEDGWVFFARSPEMLTGGIREFQGQGLPAAWMGWNNTIQNELLRDMGTGDRNLTGPDLKNVAPGTINATIETGEIPVDEKREEFQEAESLALGVLVDFCAATYTDARVITAVGKDGADEFLKLRGVDIPEVHVTVTASPQMKKLQVGEAQEMLAILQAPPPYRRFLARQYNVSPADLQQLEQDEAAWQQQQAAQAQQMQMQQMARPPMGAPQPPQLVPNSNGLNGALANGSPSPQPMMR